MCTLYQVKPAFQNALRPLVKRLATWGMTPNQITLSAIALSGGAGGAIALFPQSPYPLLALPGVLLARMALNAMDGLLARDYSLATPLGCWLNEVGDVISDILLYLPLALRPDIQAGWLVAVVILAVLTEFVGVLGLTLTDQRPYHGPMGKSDRALVFGGLGLLLGGGLHPTSSFTAVWIVLCLLEVWTIANRLQATLQAVNSCR